FRELLLERVEVVDAVFDLDFKHARAPARGSATMIPTSQSKGPRMAEFKTVCKLADVPEGLGHTVYVGEFALALFRVNGEIHAIDDTCPHMGASLGSGFVENGTVTCPWHFWRFRLADGKWADNTRLGIGCYAVRIVRDEIQVELPERPAGLIMTPAEKKP